MIGQKGIPFTEEVGGGIERHVEELATRLVARGHEVLVYVRPHAVRGRAATYRGVRVIRRPSLKTKNLDTITHTFLCTLDVLFRSADIIHYHGVGPATLSWIPRVLRPRTKIVCTFHSQDRYHLKWGAVARAYLTFGEWAATHFPHQTITVSHALESFCRNTWPRRRHSVMTITNGVSAHVHDPHSGALRRFGLEPKKYILTVARLIRHKGIHTLIQAFRGIDARIKLAIVGAPSYTQDYYRYLQELAQDDPRVLFTGFQIGDRLAALYQNALLYVHPSESEGLSLTIIEAMAHGSPVLISNIPENLETIDHAGYSFHAGDVEDLRRRMHELIREPERLAATAARGRDFVLKHFSWDRVVVQTEELYQRLMKQAT